MVPLRLLALLILGMLLSVPSLSVEPPNSVSMILKRVAEAVRMQSYTGKFTYEFGGILSTLEITHGVVDGVEFEAIQHLNGPHKEFTRLGRSEGCMSVGTHLMRGGRLLGLQGDIVSLADNYHFYIRGSDRVAGRPVSVLQIVPKDEYRYGLTLGIDDETGLLLKALIVAPSKRVLERFQFVSLELLSGDMVTQMSELAQSSYQLTSPSSCVDSTGLAKTSDGFNEGSTRVDGARAGASATLVSEKEALHIEPAWVPAGFVKVANARSDKTMQTYTDGLSSFSIFYNSAQNRTAADKTKLRQGIVQKGATTALMAVQSIAGGPLHVAVVGELPVSTARKILLSVERKVH